MNGVTRLVTLTVAVCALLVYVDAINILDFFDLGKEIRSNENKPTEKNCLCRGPSCICCVDFNMTLIDLGGPGCVRLKYLSQDLGFAVNISYGPSMLYSETVRGPNPRPTCMNLFSKLAQMCARITELSPTADGLRGCLQLEPMLLGEPQFEFPVGCFRSGPQGMEMVNPPPPQKTSENNTDSEDQQTPSINTAAIIQAVNESAIAAVESINFFTNLFGLNFGANGTEIDEYDDEEEEVNTNTNFGASGNNPSTNQQNGQQPNTNREMKAKQISNRKSRNDLI